MGKGSGGTGAPPPKMPKEVRGLDQSALESCEVGTGAPEQAPSLGPQNMGTSDWARVLAVLFIEHIWRMLEKNVTSISQFPEMKVK